MATEAPAAFHWGTGRRKSSVARVRVFESGTGDIVINGKDYKEFFPRLMDQMAVSQPLEAVEYRDKVNVIVGIHGGGLSGQAGAVRLGIARALFKMNPELRHALHEGGFLTRDSRMKERKKYGLRGARRGVQFSKR